MPKRVRVGPPGRRVQWDVTLGVLLLAAFGIWHAVATAGAVADLRGLRARGLVADATVVEVRERAGRFTDPSVVVEFTTAAGRPVRARVLRYLWRPDPRPGDAARVRYDPAAPRDRVVDDRIGPDPLGPWLDGALAAGGLLGAAFVALTMAWRE